MANTTYNNGTVAYGCYDVFTRKVAEQIAGYLPCVEPTPEKPFVPCCQSTHYCMSDNYCYGRAGNTKQTLRYYVAGCTDPDVLDPSACPGHCKGRYANTVWFNLTSNIWQCCNWDNLTGADPSDSQCSLADGDERWSVPLQKDITTMALVNTPRYNNKISSYIIASSGMAKLNVTQTGLFDPVSASSTSTASSTSSTSSASSRSNSTSSSGGSSGATDAGLSTGAKAGIGVGVGLGVVLIIAAIGLFLARKRRQQPKPQLTELGADQTATRPGAQELTGDAKVELASHPVGEMEAPALYEMPADRAAGELPAQGRN